MRRRPIVPAEPDIQGARRLLARNVHSLRKAAELTQLEASERGGLDIRLWQKVEYEDTNATLATLVRVATGLDVGIAELFKPCRSRSCT